VEIADLVRREGPIAARRIEPRVSGNSAKIRKALRELVTDGYLSKSPHTMLNPFDLEALK
jgi:predicted HTH transcriptional regulator